MRFWQGRTDIKDWYLFWCCFACSTCRILSSDSLKKEKKVQKTEQFVSSQKVVLVNGGCENMQTNPLKEETDEQMIKAVKITIQKRRPIRNLWRCMIILKSIQNPESTKIHMWRSSDMIWRSKIYIQRFPDLEHCMSKRILRKLPDNSASKEKEIREYINRIAEHEDVQALMNQTHESYQKAVSSDALWRRRWMIWRMHMRIP